MASKKAAPCKSKASKDAPQFQASSSSSSFAFEQTTEAGFEKIDEPIVTQEIVYSSDVVTLQPKEKITLPLVTADLPGQLVRVYDPSEDAVNVFHGVLLNNTSSHVLAPGAVGVFKDGRYVSERQFFLSPPKDVQLLTYAEDGSISAGRATKNDSNAQRLELLFEKSTPNATKNNSDGGADDDNNEQVAASTPKGLCLVTRHVTTTTYTFENHGEESATLLLNHVARTEHDGFEIETTEHAVKSSSGFTRYELVLKPGEKKEFRVVESAESTRDYASAPSLRAFIEYRKWADVTEPIPTDWLAHSKAVLQKTDSISALQSIGTGNFTESDIKKWLDASGLVISKDVLALTLKLLKLMDEVESCIREGDNLSAFLEQNESDQVRLRANLQALEKTPSSATSQLVQRYVAQLGTAEDKLDQARSAFANNQETLLQLKKQASDMQAQLATKTKLEIAQLQGRTVSEAVGRSPSDTQSSVRDRLNRVPKPVPMSAIIGKSSGSTSPFTFGNTPTPTNAPQAPQQQRMNAPPRRLNAVQAPRPPQQQQQQLQQQQLQTYNNVPPMLQSVSLFSNNANEEANDEEDDPFADMVQSYE